MRIFGVLLLLVATAAFPQRAVVRPTSDFNYLPGGIDSNSPVWWNNGQINVLTSTGNALLSTGSNQFTFRNTRSIDGARMDHVPFWMEAVWRDPEGVLFGWYHHEPGGLCPGNSLTAPVIGAAMSMNNGRSWTDLGIVLSAVNILDCKAQNGFFAGGHGDFSVIVDRKGENLYFLFTNYTGSTPEQGIAIARMSVLDRWGPAGAVWKFHNGDFSQPGLGGLVDPIFAARTGWETAKADSMWGPSIHYNTHIGRYVMLMNRSCCDTRWPQEGIYISFNEDIANPSGWSAPVKILAEIGFGPGWYPQVIGVGENETDTLAGKKARLYVAGISHWEIEFEPAPAAPAPQPENPEPSEEPAPSPEPPAETPPQPPTEPPSEPMPAEPTPGEPAPVPDPSPTDPDSDPPPDEISAALSGPLQPRS